MCKIKQLGQRAFIQKKKIKAEVVSCLPSVARLLPTWAKRSKLWRPSFLYPQRASQRKQRWWAFCSLGDFKRIKKKHFLHSVGNAMFMKTKRTRWVFHLFERNRIVLCSCPLFYSNCIPVFCGAHLYLQRQKTLEFFPGISDERAIFFTLCWECEGCGSWLSNGRGEHFSFTGRYFGVTLYLSREKNECYGNWKPQTS